MTYLLNTLHKWPITKKTDMLIGGVSSRQNLGRETFSQLQLYSNFQRT